MLAPSNRRVSVTPQRRLHLSGRRPSVEPDKPNEADGTVLKLWQIYADVWDWNMHQNPMHATMLGDYRFNDLLKDMTEEAHDENMHKYEDFLRQVEELDPGSLSDQTDRDNYNFLKEYLSIHIDAQRNLDVYEIPSHHMFGPHLHILQAASLHPWRDAEDAATFSRRMRAFKPQAEQMIEAYKRGIGSKRTLPQESVKALIDIYRKNVVDKAEDSVVYQAAQPKFELVGGDLGELKAAIEESVLPGFQAVSSFLEAEYLPHARPAPGVWCIPGGDKMYQSAIRYFTSMPWDPEDLHELGKREVERITILMDEVRAKVGGNTNNLVEFVECVKSNKPEWYPADGDQILESYRAVLKDSYAKLPDYFHRMPEAEMEVKAIEEFRQVSAPPAHYYPAPEDRSRKAVFYANIYQAEKRPLYQNASIALHEGVPGHHMQIALAQEMKNLPRLRKNAVETAYVEGWGLYCEYLGEVLGGFYDEPLVYFGRLMAEIWRACRLVVDTGLHHFRWTRDQACDYMRTYAGLAEQDIQTEVDRYMVMPGQALAYKVGEIEILRLKDLAQRQLGDHFSWKDFHEVVLGSGAVPLTVLEHNVKNWLHEQMASERHEEEA